MFFEEKIVWTDEKYFVLKQGPNKSKKMFNQHTVDFSIVGEGLLKPLWFLL